MGNPAEKTTGRPTRSIIADGPLVVASFFFVPPYLFASFPNRFCHRADAGAADMSGAQPARPVSVGAGTPGVPSVKRPIIAAYARILPLASSGRSCSESPHQ